MTPNKQREITMALVGAGRVATHLAHAFQPFAPFKLLYSRTFANSFALAQTLDATATAQLQDLVSADVIFLCVSDNQIATVATELASLHYQGLVVHTSGATPLSVLTRLGLRAGVFYPVQSFSLNQIMDWENLPILLEASDPSGRERLNQLAHSLSRRIYYYTSMQRSEVHLAAVFACNFSNYCIDVAQQLLIAHDLNAQLLMPLIHHTIAQLNTQSAFMNQTGPAVRADTATFQRHYALLEAVNRPDIMKLYQLMTEHIMRRHSTDDQ